MKRLNDWLFLTTLLGVKVEDLGERIYDVLDLEGLHPDAWWRIGRGLGTWRWEAGVGDRVLGSGSERAGIEGARSAALACLRANGGGR